MVVGAAPTSTNGNRIEKVQSKAGFLAKYKMMSPAEAVKRLSARSNATPVVILA